MSLSARLDRAGIARLCVLVAVLGGAPISASAQSAAGGASEPAREAKMLAERMCARCHGADGISVTPGVPSLAGQRAAYLARQLRRFQTSSAGDGPSSFHLRDSATMETESSDFSSAQMDALARYYAGLACTVPPSSPPPKRPEVAKRCLICHDSGPAGWPPLAEVPYVGGQRADYLVAELSRMTDPAGDNDRAHPVMSAPSYRISNQAIAAVADYFSRVGCARR